MNLVRTLEPCKRFFCYHRIVIVSEEDSKLIEIAKSLVKEERIPGGVVGEVGAVMRTSEGEVFSGVCMHLVCGIGFCAEHTAIATAVTRKSNIQIDTIVAVNKNGIIPPCGRCRELMNVLSENGSNTWIILDDNEKVQLADLLPRAWLPRRSSTERPEA